MNGRGWTQEESDALVDMASQGAGKIAAATGRTHSAIYSRAHKLGISLGRFCTEREAVADRFMRSVELDPNGGCWLWGAAISRVGYGQTTVKGKTVSAHRRSWEVHNGPIPNGMCVLHKCDVRACVNPAHLFLGTHQDNFDDMRAKGRSVTRRGVAHHAAKITEDQARAARQLLRDGVRPAEVARQTGVGFRTVWNMKSINAWASVDLQPLLNPNGETK